MADVYVNSEELREIAQNMKLKASNIMEAYQNDATSAILTGSESIQISGLDTTQVLNSFNKIFTNLSTRINTLADFLINMVANEYDRVSIAIKNEFDNEFANEIAKLLGLTIGTGGIGGGTLYPTPSNPGTGGAGIIDIDSSIGGNQNNGSAGNGSQPTPTQPVDSPKPSNPSPTPPKPADSSDPRNPNPTPEKPSDSTGVGTRKTSPFIAGTDELKPGAKREAAKAGNTIYAYTDTGTGGASKTGQSSSTSTSSSSGGSFDGGRGGGFGASRSGGFGGSGSGLSGKFDSPTSTAFTGGGGYGRSGKLELQTPPDILIDPLNVNNIPRNSDSLRGNDVKIKGIDISPSKKTTTTPTPTPVIPIYKTEKVWGKITNSAGGGGASGGRLVKTANTKMTK